MRPLHWHTRRHVPVPLSAFLEDPPVPAANLALDAHVNAIVDLLPGVWEVTASVDHDTLDFADARRPADGAQLCFTFRHSEREQTNPRITIAAVYPRGASEAPLYTEDVEWGAPAELTADLVVSRILNDYLVSLDRVRDALAAEDAIKVEAAALEKELDAILGSALRYDAGDGAYVTHSVFEWDCKTDISFSDLSPTQARSLASWIVENMPK
jgi:hypothetical protein